MKQHELIEVIYRQVALACECKWQYLHKIAKAKKILVHVLVEFIDRDEVAEIMGTTEKSIASHYLTDGNNLMRFDESYVKFRNRILKNIRTELYKRKNVLIAHYDTQVKAVIVE